MPQSSYKKSEKRILFELDIKSEKPLVSSPQHCSKKTIELPTHTPCVISSISELTQQPIQLTPQKLHIESEKATCLKTTTSTRNYFQNSQNHKTHLISSTL